MKAEKIKLAMMFNEYESQLIRDAAKKVISMHGHPSLSDTWSLRKNYRRIVMLAVLAYCRGVIEAGEVEDMPLIVTGLRRETGDECFARCGVRLRYYHAAPGTLTEAEMNYCIAEAIPPEEYLKRKA